MTYTKKLLLVAVGMLFMLGLLYCGSQIIKYTSNNNNNNQLKEVYSVELELFDQYFKASKLPIIENENSLCHGLNASSDFSKLAPKYAVAELMKIKFDFNYTFTFLGKDETGNVVIPMSETEIKNYKIGEYYQIDMMNICRNLFMSADNMYPSKIKSTFVKPVKVEVVHNDV